MTKKDVTIKDVTYTIQTLTLGERKEFGQYILSKENITGADANAWLISTCLVNPKKTIDEVMEMDADITDMLTIEIDDLHALPPDFLSRLQNLQKRGLQVQLQPQKKEN